MSSFLLTPPEPSHVMRVQNLTLYGGGGNATSFELIDRGLLFRFRPFTSKGCTGLPFLDAKHLCTLTVTMTLRNQSWK